MVFHALTFARSLGKLSKTEEAEGLGFQQLPRDLANINILENNV